MIDTERLIDILKARAKNSNDSVLADAADRLTKHDNFLKEASYMLNDRSRIWGGMGWNYFPISPTIYRPLGEKINEYLLSLYRMHEKRITRKGNKNDDYSI